MLKPLAAIGLCLAVSGYVAPRAALAEDGGGSCGGKLIDYIPFMVDGQKVGQLQMYYNAANGNNCAIMLHSGPTWGSARDTGVGLYVIDNKGYIAETLAFQRKSTFKYQAGPVWAKGRNRCVTAGGGISFKGAHKTLFTSRHCG